MRTYVYACGNMYILICIYACVYACIDIHICRGLSFGCDLLGSLHGQTECRKGADTVGPWLQWSYKPS